jgi:broad specificity phosphatase PhoE
MSKLYVVRHGQASFFSDDYDRLSETGERQAAALARYWIGKGVELDEVYSGTLQRQRRTAEVVGEVYREAGLDWPDHDILPGLDEYPADEIMDQLLPALSEHDPQVRQYKADLDAATEGRERYRAFHRLLAAVMEYWIDGSYNPPGLTAWRDWSDTVRAAFETILRRDGKGRRVAVFSSGGPIGVSVQTVLKAPENMAAELNWRVHNGSVTEFTFSTDRIALDSFNAVAHLDDPELLTYR